MAGNPREIPHVDRAEPDVVQNGDIVTAFGEHLDRTHVANVLLSDADVVGLTHIIEQGSDFLRFRIPRSLAPGRYSVVLTTAEQQPTLLGSTGRDYGEAVQKVIKVVMVVGPL